MAVMFSISLIFASVYSSFHAGFVMFFLSRGIAACSSNSFGQSMRGLVNTSLKAEEGLVGKNSSERTLKQW